MQSDRWAVFKVIGLVILAIVGLPIGYVSTRGSGVPATLALMLAFFAFDAAWDLAVLAMNSDKIKVMSSLIVIARSFARTVPTAFALLFLALDERARVFAVVAFVSWTVEEILVVRRNA